jgi:Fe-S-cluster-containing hydrogenase component 2
MKRNIVKIDEEKCSGCGLCANACHEGAIAMINGKAKLISDKYCDGLGNCLPACPENAIEIIEREADEYSEEAVAVLAKAKKAPAPCGCPGSAARKIVRGEKVETKIVESSEVLNSSELRQWPVQLKLVNSQADYFDGADVLIAADCSAYAYADFHKDFIKNHITLIGCPKLDDNDYYKEKLTDIFKKNNIKSISVVRMEVPCCGGIVNSVRSAILESKKIVPYNEIIIGIDGQIKKGL